jgi:5-methylcytosine-specific restriction endonuclease McrA
LNVFQEARRLDKCKCRVWGCGLSNVEVHHIIPRSAGGPDELWNLICLCSDHHRQVTQNQLQDYKILKDLKRKRDYRWQRAFEWHENKEEIRKLKRNRNAH